MDHSNCLEDGLPVDGYVVIGSPPFTSHGKAIWKGKNLILGGLTITMVINHLLTGMILQLGSESPPLLCVFLPSCPDVFCWQIF